MKRLLLEELFADDCALMAHNVHHLQVIVNELSEAAKKELTISLRKTEVLLQPTPATHPQQPCIAIDGTQVKNVESFKYLLSTTVNVGSGIRVFYFNFCLQLTTHISVDFYC